MEINRLQKLAGLPLTEAKLTEAKTKDLKLDGFELGKYDSSEDFEDAFSTGNICATTVLQMLSSAGFKDWINHSKNNYDWDGEAYKKALKAADELVKAMDIMYDELSELG